MDSKNRNPDIDPEDSTRPLAKSDDLLQLLDSPSEAVVEAFIREDVEWGLEGND
jgi:hypothetical protein